MAIAELLELGLGGDDPPREDEDICDGYLVDIVDKLFPPFLLVFSSPLLSGTARGDDNPPPSPPGAPPPF